MHSVLVWGVLCACSACVALRRYVLVSYARETLVTFDVITDTRHVANTFQTTSLSSKLLCNRTSNMRGWNYSVINVLN